MPPNNDIRLIFSIVANFIHGGGGGILEAMLDQLKSQIILSLDNTYCSTSNCNTFDKYSWYINTIRNWGNSGGHIITISISAVLGAIIDWVNQYIKIYHFVWNI